MSSLSPPGSGLVVTAPGIRVILESDWPHSKDCPLPEPMEGLGHELLKNSKQKYMVAGYFMSCLFQDASGLSSRWAGDALADAFVWATGLPRKQARWPR